MGFNILILGSQQESIFARRLLSRIEDLPWVANCVDFPHGCKKGEVAELFSGRNRPSVVVNLVPGDQQSGAEALATLNKLIPFCAKDQIPVIQLSTFRALDGLNSSTEYLDTTLVSKTSIKDSSIYAECERAVTALNKHIILRRSWIIDDGVDALLEQFVPLVLQGKAQVVSDSHYGCPITSEYFVDVLVAVIQQVLTGAENWGLYHVQSSDKCSEAEFCDYVLRCLQKELDQEFNVPAIAAPESSERFLRGAAHLTGRKLTDDFGIQLLSWRKGFTARLSEWLASQEESASV